MLNKRHVATFTGDGARGKRDANGDAMKYAIAGRGKNRMFVSRVTSRGTPDDFSEKAFSLRTRAAEVSSDAAKSDESYLAWQAAQLLLAKLDAPTAWHCRRVSDYAVRLGRRAMLDENSLWKLRLSALLHDCGKAKIKRALLQKPAALTSREEREMQRHPLRGAELLANMAPLFFALPVVQHHHERYDGRGYPDGLAGEDIPATARLVAVADAFDAMTSHRIYCQSYAPSLALNALLAGRGTQFDPIYVDLFLEEMNDGKSEKMSREEKVLVAA